MALYRQLLLSTGGGVVSGSQQDEQNECATVAIGLGGTGVTCLRNLKKQIYSRLQPDDPNAPIPKYSHIRFLAVDSDESALGADGAFNSLSKPTEFFPISSGDINGLLAQTKVLAGNPECNWLKTNEPEKGQRGLSILSATAGAGGVRQIGRLLLIEKSAEFVSKVQGIIEDATRGLPGNAELVIHIFAGIGGGTGSGTLLDACYLVQEALNRVALKGKANICGYIFMPDVNLSNIDEGAATARYIKANAFAAMKELDYCMNFQNNHGCWNQEYKGFHIGPVQDTPVKVCHLISAHNVAGTNLTNGFAYAMNVVSDFVMQFLVKPEPPNPGESALTIQSHIGNYFKNMEVVNKTAGACHQYCLLGASKAIVPMKEIATYLSSFLFEEMSSRNTHRPADDEVARFAEDIGLSYDKLEQSILSGTNYRMPAINMDYKQCPAMTEEDINLPKDLILPEVISKPYRDRLLSDMKKRVTTNMHAMTNPWSLSVIQKDDSGASKVCAAFFALRNLVIDPECGPFYAADLLNGSQTTNLVNHLRGIHKQAKENLLAANNDYTLRIQAVKKARNNFLHAGMSLPGKKKNLFKEFIAAVANYFTQLGYIFVLEQIDSMMPVMIKQFIQLYEEHFMVYQAISRNLFDTFHENYQTLSTASLSEAIADPFTLPLMKIEDMKESLDKMVRSMKADIQMQNFHMFLFDKPDIWRNGDEHKISKEVSNYLVSVFHEYTNRSLTDYLEIRFNTGDPAKLADLVHDEIMVKLKDKAEALFWKASGFNISEANPLGYISAPDSASVIITAAETLNKENKYLAKCPSKMKDRIFILKCLCGVPMYAYNGVDDYRNVYAGDSTVGKHLYELTDRDARDWRSLSNLRPYSTINNPDSEMEKRAKEYDRAEELGIIRVNPNFNALDSRPDYQLIVWPPIDELVQSAEAAIAEKSDQPVKQAVAAIESYQREKQPVKTIPVANDGMQGHELKVRKDHVVASREMIETIREELAKLERLEELTKRLEEAKTDIGRGVMQKEQFFNALCAGVIVINIPKVSYIEESFGITKEIPLSEPRMEPYGKFVPLYQAYVTYSNLSVNSRTKLDQLTEDRINNDSGNWQTVMQSSCDQLLKVFNDRYMGLMQAQAQKLPDDTETIVDFLLAFRQKIEDFKLMYGLM